MVAVCVVANTVFPVTVSIEDVAEEPTRLIAKVRQENGDITPIKLTAERSAAIRAKHGNQRDALVGMPWRQVLAEL